MVPQQQSTPSSATASLQVRGLECVRGSRRLFSALAFDLHPGELLLVEGPNGSGKTTLLRILCGLALATDGEVRWQGRPVQEARGDIAYVGHSPGVNGVLTPLENLRLAAHLVRHSGKEFDTALQRLGLGPWADTPCQRLSEGQRRRVGLARLLLSPARLWILDEPFTSLDADGVTLTEELLTAHVAQGGSVVLTTHQPTRVTVSHRLQLREQE